MKIIRLFAHKNNHTEQSGFVMTTVIFLMSIMAVIAYAALLQSNNGLNLSYKQSYLQMARVASKAAVDYAQEQFDQSSCGAYTGTSETDLVSNNHYRITFKVDVTSTSTDGLEKSIVGTGSIYLPKLSATAKYVFDVRSEIIRTYAACKTPDNFAPLVWLDASNTASLKKIGTSTTTANPTTSYGNVADSTRDTLEERVDDGSQTVGSWQSDDFEMNTCDSTEFSNAICTTSSSKYIYNGMIFSNVTIPKNSTITSATITLACTTPSGSNGTLTDRIYGLYKTSTNLHPDLFIQGASSQIKTPLATSGLHTTAYVDVTSNNCPPGNNTVYDVTSVAREIVNNTNWDPSTGGGRMGFSFQRQSGSGTRHLLKNGNLFSISYSTSTVAQANNGDSIGEWDDLSGNGNHARFGLGTAPVRVDNQINSKSIVRFSNGTLVSDLTAALSGKREMTVLAVIKPNFTTSSTDGRAITGMTSTATNDTGGNTGIIPLLRNGSGSGFSSNYSGSGTTYRTNYVCGGTCASTPYIFADSFTIDSTTNKITAVLKGNGQPVATKTGISPSGSPYTFGINQLYYGGRRNGTGGSAVGADYLNGDYAELVVYDKALDCRQIEALEEYLRSKWAISASPYSTTCPADAIPTL